MRKLIFMLAFLFSIGMHVVYAQTTISGTVTDDKGEPVPGANIRAKGYSDVGTISDLNGQYNLNVPAEATILVYSFVGMAPQEVEIGGQTVINVSLENEDVGIEEVVITALGISREKKSLGFASTSLGGDEIADAKVVNPMNALQGKVAGLDISTASGPGATQNVMIRGASSFGSNQPLFVVDGVPIINTQITSGSSLNNNADMGSGINSVNPDDIENMTVLKGAAATALYGSRAANGVILIKTKSGKNTGDKMKIAYDGSFALSRIGRIPDRQDQFGQGWNGDHSLVENGNWGPKYTGEDRVYGFELDGRQLIKPYAFVDSRVRDFYDYGTNIKNALSLSGGNETTTYFFSLSNNNTDGVYPGDVDTYKRTTLSAKGSHQWKAVKVSTSLNYSNENTQTVPSGQGTSVFRSLWEIAEDYSVVDMKDYNNEFWNLDNYYTLYGVNPYFSLNENGSELKKSKIYGKFQLDFDITSDLKAMYRFGGDLENSVMDAWQAQIKIPASANSYNDSKLSTGSYESQSRKRYEFNHDMYLTYAKNLSDKFNLNVLLGANINQVGYNRVGGTLAALDVAGFYNFSNGTADPVSTQYSEERKLFGVFGNAELAYSDYLFLTLTARNDWSSTLPKENNSYFYPGATLSFIVTEMLERAGTTIGFMDFAKVRVAYGWTGKDAPVYSIYPVYISGLIDAPGYPNMDDLAFPLNGINSWMIGNQLGSPDLAPEITKEFEVGLDMNFFKNRLGFEFSYYNKLTEGLISTQPLDPSSGYTSIVSNIGDVRNKGIELEIHGSPIKTSDFEWQISVNYTENQNKVEDLAEGEVFLGGYGGLSIVAIKGEELGVFKAEVARTVMIDGVEHPVVDGSGIPQSSPDEQVMHDKSINEKFRLGLTNSFRYKNFILGATFDLRYGGYIYSYQKDYMGWTGSGAETVYNDRKPFIIPNSVQEVSDGVYVENTSPVETSKLHTFYTDGGFERKDNFLLDKSYMKLRQLSLSYELPKSFVSKLKLSSIRASLVAGNILLWTADENLYIDPEVTSFGNDVSAKFGEFGAGPTNQTYTFGLSIVF